MAPASPARPPSSPSTSKAPPTGPKAQRPLGAGGLTPAPVLNGGRIPFIRPQSQNAVAGPSSHTNGHHARPNGNGTAKRGFQPVNGVNMFSTNALRQTVQQQQLSLLQQQEAHEQQLQYNQRSSSSGTGHSHSNGNSRTKAPPAGPSHPLPAPPLLAPPSPPPLPAEPEPIIPKSTKPLLDKRDRSKSPVRYRSKSPVKLKLPAESPKRELIPVKVGSKNSLRPVNGVRREKISFSIPLLSNGQVRPRPPHLDVEALETDRIAQIAAKSAVKPKFSPIALPFASEEKAPPPPPPLSHFPAPPPSPPSRSAPAPPPSPPSSRPPSQPFAPTPRDVFEPPRSPSRSNSPVRAQVSRSKRISPPPKAKSGDEPAPPTFHFRELHSSRHKSGITDSDDDSSGSERREFDRTKSKGRTSTKRDPERRDSSRREYTQRDFEKRDSERRDYKKGDYSKGDSGRNSSWRDLDNRDSWRDSDKRERDRDRARHHGRSPSPDIDRRDSGRRDSTRRDFEKRGSDRRDSKWRDPNRDNSDRGSDRDSDRRKSDKRDSRRNSDKRARDRVRARHDDRSPSLDLDIRESERGESDRRGRDKDRAHHLAKSPSPSPQRHRRRSSSPLSPLPPVRRRTPTPTSPIRKRIPTSTPPPPSWRTPDCVKNRETESYFTILSAQGKELDIRRDGKIDGHFIEVVDPRLLIPPTSSSSTTFNEIQYDWNDISSVGKRPVLPPTAILITQLDPLTTGEQIRTFLRPHGRIREFDSKMDQMSGMQLGICWVKFDGPASGMKQKGQTLSAHDVAVNAAKACDGKRVGMNAQERIKVVLDGRGLRAEKAVKEEMAKRYPPKVRPTAPPPPPPPTQISMPPPVSTPMIPLSTPNSGHATPMPHNIPSRPLPVAVPLRALTGNNNYRPQSGIPARPPIMPPSSVARTLQPTSYPRPYRSNYNPVSVPARPPINPRPVAAVQQLAPSFTAAPFRKPRKDTYIDRGRSLSRGSRNRGQSYNESRSRSRNLSHSPDYTTSSESDSDDLQPRRRQPSPEKPKVPIEDLERTKKTLEANGHPALFIPVSVLAAVDANEIYLKDHFKRFKPESILRASDGFYILFANHGGAEEAAFLDGSLIHGNKLTLSIKSEYAKARPSDSALPASSTAVSGRRALDKMSFGKKKSALSAPSVVIPMRPAPVPRKKRADTEESEEVVPIRKRAPSISSISDLSSEEEVIVKPKPRVKTKAKVIRKIVVPDEDSVVVRTPTPVQEDLDVEGEEEMEDEEVTVKIGKKRAGPAKTAKKGKKARVESPAPLVEPPSPPPEPEVAEIKLPPKKAPPPKKVAKPKKIPPGPLDKLVADGIIEDEEDAYWLSQALAEAEDPAESEEEDEEESLLPEDHPLHHVSGSWRAQGLRKVPHALKSAYLPQRNRAQAAAEATASSAAGGHGLTTGRTARVTGRRLAHDMETHRKTTTSTATAESDLFAFNQLRIRKKQLRFARSAIEGYGLYAMETIQPGEMVCEYVGELIRSVVADLREARYTKQGIGSSYLFRIDGDVVCDATFRGSVSRLINHSCDPSASAKIISINGVSKIVIYAKRLLSPGEEILYDYKFPLESDPALRVPCLCGSKICRGFLN